MSVILLFILKKKKGKREPAAPDPSAEAAEREAQRRTKETAERVRQIVETHRLERGAGELAYHFTRGCKIKEIWLGKVQHRRLGDGEIGLVTVGEGYDLVPKTTAERIRGINPEAVLVLNSGTAEPEDDAYADFPVPDDLMW